MIFVLSRFLFINFINSKWIDIDQICLLNTAMSCTAYREVFIGNMKRCTLTADAVVVWSGNCFIWVIKNDFKLQHGARFDFGQLSPINYGVFLEKRTEQSTKVYGINTNNSAWILRFISRMDSVGPLFLHWEKLFKCNAKQESRNLVHFMKEMILKCASQASAVHSIIIKTSWILSQFLDILNGLPALTEITLVQPRFQSRLHRRSRHIDNPLVTLKLYFKSSTIMTSIALVNIPYNDKLLLIINGCINLRSVWIENYGRNVSDNGFKALVGSSSKLQRVCVCSPDRHLDRNSNINYVVTNDAFAAVVLSCRSLTCLYIYGEECVTDQLFLSISRDCLELKFLHIGMCYNLTNRILEYLKLFAKLKEIYFYNWSVAKEEVGVQSFTIDEIKQFEEASQIKVWFHAYSYHDCAHQTVQLN